MTGSEGNNSISDVVKQPAFIAGLGGLVGLSSWASVPGCTGGEKRGRDSATMQFSPSPSPAQLLSKETEA
ncbi:hypothetical protein INR49_015694 [Caranx melampygus]|nr:hypothetical protein INR49_015694 [Caranx melampygus]